MEYGTCSVSKFANLEPGDSIQHLMQTGWDQQTVDETKDTGTQRASAHDPLTTRMDGILYRWPYVTEDSSQHQTEEASGDRHEAFAAKEAQEVRQFDTRPAVIHRTADQTGDDTSQHAHIDCRVNGNHCFGQYEITDRTCQRCCTCAVF